MAVPIPPTPPVTRAIFLSMRFPSAAAREPRAGSKKNPRQAWGLNLYPVMR
jgi:hypothetical protein